MIDGFLPCHADNFKVGSNRKILYLVMHYTGNNGDTALGNCNYFARPKLLTSAHYFVDETSIWQSVKDKDIAYHCGRTDGKYVHPECRNANSIGIEMCSRKNADGSYYIKPEVVARAADLVKHLMAQYGIDTAHIVQHYDVTGKECPRPWVRDESLWDGFKEGLEEQEMTEQQIRDIVTQTISEQLPVYRDLESLPYGREEVQRMMSKGLIRGDENGLLYITPDFLQTLVVLDRMMEGK